MGFVSVGYSRSVRENISKYCCYHWTEMTSGVCMFVFIRHLSKQTNVHFLLSIMVTYLIFENIT